MADIRRSIIRAARAVNNRLYKWSGGRFMGKIAGVRVLLLTVAGRNTGVEHTTPVSYFEDGGSYVVTGSGGGSASDPQWFQNLRRADHAVIEVGSRRMDVIVSVAGPQERTVLWQKLIARSPAFVKTQAKVEREFPMAVLTPTP